MRVGVYIPKTLPEPKRKALFADIERKMSVGARITNASGSDSCIILNPLVENFFADNNGDSLCENKRTHNCDAIIIAQHINDVTLEADMANEMARFKAANPHKLVALYYDLPSHDTAATLKTGSLFNGMAKGADLVYAELPQDPESLALGLKPHSRSRTLRSLMHAIRDKRIMSGIRSPELFTPSTDKILKFGNITIDTDHSSLSLPNGMPVTDLTEKHVTILAALARYHGSYLPIDLLMREVYKDEIANAKSKGYVYTPPAAKIIDVFCCRLKDIFARNGFGEIERLWGVGRHIKPEAFMVLDAVKFDGNAPKEYAFSYDAALGVVNHPMIDNPIHLTPSENHLFSALMSSPGQVMKREMLLDTHDTKGVDVAMVKLREKLGGLYPDIEGFGHILIHTLHGRGYRLRPPAELEYLMDKARAEPPARRLRTSYPAANRDSSGFLGALKT